MKMTFEEIWNQTEHIAPLIAKEEGQCIWDLTMQLPRKSTIVEIGCYVGKSSFILASACNEINSNLICIDPFVIGFDGIVKYDNTREIFKKNILEVFDNVKLYDMESSMAHKYIKEIDYLFIDGDHEYEGVVKDCINYLPKLKRGHCVTFHDYTNKGLCGVKKGVDEFCNDWEVVNNIWSVTTRRKP